LIQKHQANAQAPIIDQIHSFLLNMFPSCHAEDGKIAITTLKLLPENTL